MNKKLKIFIIVIVILILIYIAFEVLYYIASGGTECCSCCGEGEGTCIESCCRCSTIEKLEKIGKEFIFKE